MCDPTGIAIGAAIGAATSAATGQDPLMGAVLGGATGGFMPGGVGVSPTAFGPQLSGTFVTGFGSSIALGGVAQAAGIGLLGGALMNKMMPKPYEYPSDYGSQQIQQAQTSQNKITGSGGAQASALLASEIQRVKRARSKPQMSALNTQAFQTTGLQLA